MSSLAVTVDDLERTLDGKGFFHSVAYDAYLTLPGWSFWLQCVVCIALLGGAYVWRYRLLAEGGRILQGRSPRLRSFVAIVGPSLVFTGALILCVLGLYVVGATRADLRVLVEVFQLTALVLGVRTASWFFRKVMRAHQILQFFVLLIEWVLVMSAVLAFFGLFHPLKMAVHSIEFSVGNQVFKGMNIVGGVSMAVLALAVAGQLAEMVAWGLEKYKSREGIGDNDALILTRLFTVTLFLITVVAVLVGSGIEATTLSAFGAALGIGLGFGLQEVVLNFFSGLYLLFERAIKPGDYVSINGVSGRVDRLTSRAIVIRDGVGTESLIPNSFITKGMLQNHTLSNNDYRVSFHVHIARASDYVQTRALVIQAMQDHPRVLQDKPMNVLMVSVYEGYVKLEASLWINDLHNGRFGLVSDLQFDIATRLAAAGVPLAQYSASA
jgi:small-conductance mechanosensitive channel